MRKRYFRPYIYLPSYKWGVASRDWKYVGAAVVAAFLIPLILGIRIAGFPVSFPLSVLTLLGLVAFFNYVRTNRRQMWFEHELISLRREITGKTQNLLRTTNQENRQLTNWMTDYTPEKTKF